MTWTLAVSGISGVIYFFLSDSPFRLISGLRVQKRRRTEQGEESSAWVQIRLTTASLEKISPSCQLKSPPTRIADSSSTNAVSFSSARSTNASRCLGAHWQRRSCPRRNRLLKHRANSNRPYRVCRQCFPNPSRGGFCLFCLHTATVKWYCRSNCSGLSFPRWCCGTTLQENNAVTAHRK